MNKVTLLGRLTKDPELRKTMSGDSFTSFQLAVKRPRSKDKTDFIGCVAWNKAAELICTYIKKGQQIGITGMLQTRSYERDGSTTKITEVYVEEFDFVGKADAYAQAEGIPDEALPF